MRAQAADTIARAEREGLSYAGLLAELLMAECEDRDRRRAERRIRAAHFPREKSLREFDYSVNLHVDPAVIHNLATCEWIAKGHPYHRDRNRVLPPGPHQGAEDRGDEVHHHGATE